MRVFLRGAPGVEVDPRGIHWGEISAERFPFRLRQEPGPWNALGRLKFVFANSHAVYMHDTPRRDLFARTTRAFSHGCIRLEKPLDLAEMLLGPQSGWTRQRLLESVEHGATRFVRLPTPIPIRIVYRTAWVDEDGTVEFRSDFCHRDA